MINKLAIITVIYNNYRDIYDLLTSLKKQTNKNFHLFLIDVSDEKKLLNTKDIPTTILKTSNSGYATGINIGLKQAQSAGYTNFCIINDDTTFEKDFVEKAIATIASHPSAIIGGKIYYAAGHEYHVTRYKKSDRGRVLWYAGGIIDWNHALTKHRGVDEVDTGQYDMFEKTEFIAGTLVLLDSLVLKKVGFWDETYFLYYEDADFCERAKQAGINLYYDPSVVIWHKVSQSTGGSGSSLHAKYQNVNRVRFGLRYAPWRTKIHLVKNFILDRLKSR